MIRRVDHTHYNLILPSVVDVRSDVERKGIVAAAMLADTPTFRATSSTRARPLAAAKSLLEAEGIDLAFSDIAVVGASAEASVRQQARGSHADEIETSMMLYIRPDRVDMGKAVKDDSEGSGPLTRRKDNAAGTYSASGVWGDPTLATREKGRVVVEGMVADILAEIEVLRSKPPR